MAKARRHISRWQRYFIIVQLKYTRGQRHRPGIVLMHSISGPTRCILPCSLSPGVKLQLRPPEIYSTAMFEGFFQQKRHVPGCIMFAFKCNLVEIPRDLNRPLSPIFECAVSQYTYLSVLALLWNVTNCCPRAVPILNPPAAEYTPSFPSACALLGPLHRACIRSDLYGLGAASYPMGIGDVCVRRSKVHAIKVFLVCTLEVHKSVPAYRVLRNGGDVFQCTNSTRDNDWLTDFAVSFVSLSVFLRFLFFLVFVLTATSSLSFIISLSS